MTMDYCYVTFPYVFMDMQMYALMFLLILFL